jgi:hypothetical protein
MVPLGGPNVSVEKVHADFYTTLAEVLPLLLLAFIWDSGFLARLRSQHRPLRSAGAGGVRFWTKPRVRVYTLGVAAIVVVCTATAVLVLAGVVADSRALRIALSAGLAVVLLTLMTRITIDVLWATADTRDPAEAGAQSSRADDSGPASGPAEAPGSRP